MARPPAASLIGSADEVEAEFYEALRRGDVERLMALWADDDEIVCVHPGGMRIVGGAAIRASFEAIFANGGIPVRPEQVHRLAAMGSALHHLVERIEVSGEQGPQTAWVTATNLYLKTTRGWRLASHHASPALGHEPPVVGGEPPSTLH
ncbi:MAG: nuclear transport factor 2 family protein [Rubrivivax sp.]|nr:nuclear transport factor 2 family protein [Rubrivivax sp.]